MNREARIMMSACFITVALVALLFCSGCMIENGSYAVKSTTVGLIIGVDASKIPTVRLGYTTTEFLAVKENQEAEITKDYDDVNFFTGSGNIDTSIIIKPKEAENESREP